VTHSIEGYIFLNSEVMHTVSGASAIVGMMNCIALNERTMHSSDHVEVNSVAAELEGLTSLSKLDVVNASNGTLITR